VYVFQYDHPLPDKAIDVSEAVRPLVFGHIKYCSCTNRKDNKQHVETSEKAEYYFHAKTQS